jgi:hypothetical protein
MSDLYDPDVIAWDAKMKEAFDRIEALLVDLTTARSDRIREMLQSISEHFGRPGGKRLLGGGPSMPDEQLDEHIKALLEHHTAQRRRESDRAAARERGRLLQAEREKSLPADVPLHQRGFGVMDEDGA